MDQNDQAAILEQLTEINQGIKDLNAYYQARDQKQAEDAAALAAATDKKAEDEAAAQAAADAQLAKEQEAQAKVDDEAKKAEDERFEHLQQNQEATNDLLVTINDGLATISSQDDTDFLESFKQQNEQLIANTSSDQEYEQSKDDVGILADSTLIFFVLGLLPAYVIFRLIKGHFGLLNNIF